jgi:hypothetical protein
MLLFGSPCTCSPYFALAGKYPNRAYPKIFEDETVGAQASQLFAEANTMLRHIIDNKLLVAKVLSHSPLYSPCWLL